MFTHKVKSLKLIGRSKMYLTILYHVSRIDKWKSILVFKKDKVSKVRFVNFFFYDIKLNFEPKSIFYLLKILN